MLGADYVTFDPAWPWSLPGIGLWGLAGAGFLLAALTIWTYRGVRGASPRRISGVLVLRLLALVLASLLVLRPSLAMVDDENKAPSKLLFLLDSSASMALTDEFNSKSRWDNANRILKVPAVDDALKRLAGDKVEVVYYQGAEDLRPFEPDGQPEGKRTDVGGWLNEILRRHGAEKNLRGLILFSDGADNGSRFSAREKAAQFRGFCPIHAFGLGKTVTTKHRNDIALVDIAVEPSPVPIKTKLTVKAIVNAPTFEGTNVDVSLWIDALDGKGPRQAGKEEQVQLRNTEGNEIVLVRDAPEKPGEIKVTVKIKPQPQEVTDLNNEISTYVSLTSEGVSILWVEGRRRQESAFAIRHALSRDPRFRITYVEKLPGAKPVGDDDWLNLDKRHYDVIVIGDISAQRLSDGAQQVFKKINRRVTQHKTGLLFLGGLDALAASDWHLLLATEVSTLLPVDLGRGPEPRQIDQKVRVQPTPAGLTYLLRLDENKDKNDLLWTKHLHELEGLTNLGVVKPSATVLATGGAGAEKYPVLASATQGGRVVVFAGDTTYKVWRRTKEALAAYERFWKQLMLYSAQQENTDSTVWVKLDRRRVPAGANHRVPFTVGVRGKNGQIVPNPEFKVKVIGPNKEETEVLIAQERGEYRGYFWKTELAGDYRIEAFATGKDAEGNDLPGTPGVARFLCHAEDLEMLRTGADHDALEKIALDSGGRFQLADERRLLQLLESLHTNRAASLRPKVELWPDWRQSLPPGSPAGDQLRTLWNSTALPLFLAFVTLLCIEWFLRRRWGLV